MFAGDYAAALPTGSRRNPLLFFALDRPPPRDASRPLLRLRRRDTPLLRFRTCHTAAGLEEADGGGRHKQLPDERRVRLGRLRGDPPHRVLLVLPGAVSGHHVRHQDEAPAPLLRLQPHPALFAHQRHRYGFPPPPPSTAIIHAFIARVCCSAARVLRPLRVRRESHSGH